MRLEDIKTTPPPLRRLDEIFAQLRVKAENRPQSPSRCVAFFQASVPSQRGLGHTPECTPKVTRKADQGNEKRATLPFAGPNLAASTGCPSNVSESRPARFPTVILNGASPATCCTLPALTRPENTSLPSF